MNNETEITKLALATTQSHNHDVQTNAVSAGGMSQLLIAVEHRLTGIRSHERALQAQDEHPFESTLLNPHTRLMSALMDPSTSMN